jgi:hypothetical protein
MGCNHLFGKDYKVGKRVRIMDNGLWCELTLLSHLMLEDMGEDVFRAQQKRAREVISELQNSSPLNP